MTKNQGTSREKTGEMTRSTTPLSAASARADADDSKSLAGSLAPSDGILQELQVGMDGTPRQDTREVLSRADTPAQGVTFDVQIAMRESRGEGEEEDGMRGRTCTPASFVTDFTELKSLDDPHRKRLGSSNMDVRSNKILHDNYASGPDKDDADTEDEQLKALADPDPESISNADTQSPSPLRCRILMPSNPTYADTREMMFQQAINLMSERCPSMAHTGRDSAYSRGRTPLFSSKATPVGTVTTKYFYIEQKKPTPMPPLKAWRGYNGNVYFEPIKVGNAPGMTEKDADSPRSKIPENCSPTLKQILETKSRLSTRGRSAMRSKSALEDGRGGGSPTRILSPNRSRTAMELRNTSPSRASAKTTRSTYSYAGPRQMSILDKSSILDRENDKIREDLSWVINQESTGSLCIEPMPRNKHERKTVKEKNTQNDKEKICRGSVAHKIYAMKNQRIPLLSVTGDKFQQSTLPNPLMRTQTQYSQSSQRMTMNSPDLYHIAMMQGYDKLQPLEQLRASLKQIEHSGNPDSSLFSIPAMERIKFEDPNINLKNQPYVKYTPELKNSLKRSNQPQTVQKVK